MIHDVPPDQYLDEASRRGVVVVLLHVNDTMYRRARYSLEQAEYRFSGRAFRFSCCHVKDGQDAAEVQAIKFPQFRFFVNGSERSSHVGIMTDDEIAKAIFEILESPHGQ
jgi:hypothetical protein